MFGEEIRKQRFPKYCKKLLWKDEIRKTCSENILPNCKEELRKIPCRTSVLAYRLPVKLWTMMKYTDKKILLKNLCRKHSMVT